MPIEYDHLGEREAYSVRGARETLRTLFPNRFPASVLDVGCGAGTWLAAALECGATYVLGLDGAEVPARIRRIPADRFRIANLNAPLDLGRRFDLLICLETAEHLEPDRADTLIDSLVRHGDRILFSAAAPGQRGTHHVNCQWPSYWQQHFNARGFVCSDAARWAIWDNPSIEPWYRQNLMLVRRNKKSAGTEPRIASVLHPEIVEYNYMLDQKETIEDGALPLAWYALAPFKAARGKFRRALRRR